MWYVKLNIVTSFCSFLNEVIQNITLKLCPQLNSDKEDTDDRQEDEDLVTNSTDYNDTKRRKKKKHKKLKNERVKSQQEHDAECNENIDEIERSIREVNKLLGEPLPGCSTQVLEAQLVDDVSKEDILTVQRKHLNPCNELKKIFGSKTIEAEQRYNYIYTYNYMYSCINVQLMFVFISFC